MTRSSLDPAAALWRDARAWFAALMAPLGHPGAIAALARDACIALARELAALRSVVLKLLLVEAARLPKPQQLPRRAALQTAAPACRVDDVAQPETWNVRLSLRLPRLAQPRRRSWSEGESQPRIVHALELARRCEALRRALADPAPLAARLARRLHALGGEARLAARRIAWFRPLGVPRGRSMLHARASVCAHDHAFCFEDTG